MGTQAFSPKNTQPLVLVLATEALARDELAKLVAELGYACTAVGPDCDLLTLDHQPIEAAILEAGKPLLVAPLLRRLQTVWPDLGAVVIHPERSAPESLLSITNGAADVLGRPFGSQELAQAIEKAIALGAAPPEAARPAGKASRFIGTSKAIAHAEERLKRVAPGTATVLLRGESGTGKDLAARALHEHSPRRNAPFIKAHCAALPDTLLESELFGYERGAFTGARARKPGRVDLAQGGTLFLDEIGDIPPQIQVKLLRLLQDREYERLGGEESLQADIRFIAATHRDLDAMVKANEFRADLFYRLNVVTVWLPPLRARREDIIPLAKHFCEAFGKANSRATMALAHQALLAIQRERWPGNVRQLSNFVERLVLLSEGPEITADDVARELKSDADIFITQEVDMTSALRWSTIQSSEAPAATPVPELLSDTLWVAERSALMRALKHAKDNRSLAARMLGISRATLYKKLDEHGIG